MGHIVVFEGADRNPAFHRCEELADAVSFVEKLRNDRGVDNVQIYRTEEIKFDFKPYYRVELGTGSTPSSSPALGAPSSSATSDVSSFAPIAPPPPPISSMAAPSEPQTGSYEDNGDDLSVSGTRRGLFGR
ncbi:MAG TPA: hypothetical protein VF183_14390 [Acidimicrobiales bacterium]